MNQKLITLFLLFASLSVFSMPPDSMVIPIEIGDSVTVATNNQKKFDRGCYISFTTKDTSAVLVDINGRYPGEKIREITLYSDSATLFYRSTGVDYEDDNNSAFFIPKCIPGTYYIFFNLYIIGQLKFDIRVDTFQVGYSPQLIPLKTYIVLTPQNDTLQYNLNMSVPTLFNLLLHVYEYESIIKTWLWSPDTNTLIKQVGKRTDYFESVCSGALPKGIYPLKLTGHSKYSLVLNTRTVNKTENERNNTYDSADTIALDDTVKAAFFDWTDNGLADTIDWFSFNIVKECLVKLTSNAKFTFYSFVNNTLDSLYDSSDVRDFIIGRLYPGTYYMETSGKSSANNLFIKTEDILPVKNIIIDSTHLVYSNNFDKGPSNNTGEFVLDRNYCLRKAVKFNKNGFLIDSLKINNGQLVNNFTVSFWAYVKKPNPDYQTLISIGTVDYTSNPSLWILLNMKNELEIRSEDSIDQKITTVPATITSSWYDRWSHLAITVNNKNMTIYVNGKNVLKDTIRSIENYKGINFGQSKPDQPKWRYFGSLDDFYVFNVALDSAGIQKLIDIDFPASIKPFKVSAREKYILHSYDGNSYSIMGQKLPKSVMTNQIILKRANNNEKKKPYQKILKLK